MYHKRFTAFLLICMIWIGCCLFPAAADEDVIFSADFEEASGFGSVTGSFSLPGGTVRIFNDGFYRAESDETHGRYMVWECDTPGKNVYVPVTLTARPSSDYILSMDFCYEELAAVKAGQCTLNLIQFYSLSPAKEWYNLLNMEQDGTLFAYSGSGKSDAERLELGRLEPGAWYTVEVLVDVSTEQYAVRLNGDLISPVLHIAASATSGDYSGMTVSEYRLIGFNAIVSGRSCVGFDNIRIAGCDDLNFPTDEPERVNLFAGAPVLEGRYDEEGAFLSDADYQTRVLAVQPGSELTIAAFSQKQTIAGALLNADGECTRVLELSELTEAEALAGGYSIRRLNVPSDCASVAVTVPARRAYITLVTEDDPFDSSGYYHDFGISAMTGRPQVQLWQKRALFVGDSIAAGFCDTSVGNVQRAWAGRVAYDYDMTYVNAAVSGATLSTASGKRVVDQLRQCSGDFDYVLLQGGINDAAANVPVGSIGMGTEGAEPDLSTYAGALEELLATAVERFPDAAIGFVTTYNAVATGETAEVYGTYQEVTREICEKWNVPLMDWYADPNINDITLAVDTDFYLEDGLHPNSLGYDRLTPYVESFLAELSPWNTQTQPEESGESSAEGETETPSPQESASPTDSGAPDPENPSGGCASSAGVAGLWLLLPAVAVLLFRRRRGRSKGRRWGQSVSLLLLPCMIILPACTKAPAEQPTASQTPEVSAGESTNTPEEPEEPGEGIMLSEEVTDGNLRIYPVPDSYRRSKNARITVNGHSAPLVYGGSVYDPLANYDSCSFAAGVDEAVTLEITVAADIEQYEISCQSAEPRAEVSGNTLTIVTEGPHDMIVKINDLREIVICADPPETDVPASEGSGIYNVAAQYGADTSGQELATAAFYKAIRDAAAAGGGTVYVPNGVYLISNLILQSNVSLYLEAGAYLMCTEDTSVLSESERKTTEHGHTVDYPISWMFTTASGSENIRIYGRGTIDGRGALMKQQHGWLINLIRTNKTSDFTLEGVTLRDSSHWGCIIYGSTQVSIRGTKHLNLVKNLNEDDGIDICSSRNVEVLDTLVISQDDPYSVKSYAVGETSDVRFEGGLTWTRCAAAKVGYGHVTNVSNIAFRNITAHRCMFGVNITQYQGQADTTNVTFENITVNGFTLLSDHDRASWILIDYKDESTGGNVRGITVSDIRIRSLELLDGYSGRADNNVINSLSESANVDGVILRNITIDGQLCRTLEEMEVTLGGPCGSVVVEAA